MNGMVQSRGLPQHRRSPQITVDERFGLGLGLG